MPDSDWWARVAAERDRNLEKYRRDVPLSVDPGPHSLQETRAVVEALEHRLAYLVTTKGREVEIAMLNELLVRWNALLDQWRAPKNPRSP